jgi:hypothetical protein
MRAKGYTLVQVWLDQEDHQAVSDQAKKEGRPIANYLRFHALERARRQKANPLLASS